MNIYRHIFTITLVFFIYSCGSGGKPEANTQYYKKQNTETKKLELSIEASGVIEAISSVEIKSKASGEILFLGAEVGDFIEKGRLRCRSARLRGGNGNALCVLRAR